MEQIVKLEKEMSQVHTQYKDVEQHYGSDLLNLVLAKGFIAKLLANESVKYFIEQNEAEILEHFELVVNTVSMEEAVQQQQNDGLAVGADPQSSSQPLAAQNHLDATADNFQVQPQQAKR